MKKITILFLFTMLILAVPVIATLEANNITSDLKLTQKNQEITATISINNLNTTGTKALTGKIKFDSNTLEYVENKFLNSWNGAVSNDGTSFTVYTSQEENINEIVTLKFKIKSDTNVDETKISINNISLALEEGNGDPENEIKVQETSKTIQIENAKNSNTQILTIAIIAIVVVIAVLTLVYITKKKDKKAE